MGLAQSPFLLWAAQCLRGLEQRLSAASPWTRVPTLTQEKPRAQAGRCGRGQDVWSRCVSWGGWVEQALQELSLRLLF